MSSSIGKFIRSRTSWTLPDTRPQAAAVARSKLGMLRVSAEAFHEAHKRDKANQPVWGAHGARASRPGEGPREAFHYRKAGETRKWARSKSRNMRFGAWST